jgi:hypothetical protein
MKNKIFFLSIFAAGFLSACSSSDTGGGKVATDGMQIGVCLPATSSRVTETASSTSGLTTAWESSDKLNIFHLYNNANSTASMIGLEFKNSSSAGSSGTFVYTGTSGTAAGYSFNPSNNLYAFNELPTTGNFTQTKTGSSDFTLNLSGFTSQDGTVGNLKNYDALYGVSLVGSNGTPAGMTMNHLTSMIRFDLTNSDFTSALTNVTFTCGSASTSILPSSGSFALSSSGAVTNETLTGATSWTVSNVAASSGTAPVYLMTFPFQNVSGTLTITATTSAGTSYFRTITLSSLSLASGKVKAYTVTLIRTPNPTPYTGQYYEWDATAVYPADYNTITSGVATNCCKNCPTLLQIQMYLGAGVMWDTSKLGLWLKKPDYIAGFAAGTAPTVAIGSDVTPATVTNYSNPDGQYFFLPAAGFIIGGSVGNSGTNGYYWSSTPYSNSYYAYYLGFNSTDACVRSYNTIRNCGFCLW